MSLSFRAVIEIPDAGTLFDHGALDPEIRRVFVADTARDRVEVIGSARRPGPIVVGFLIISLGYASSFDTHALVIVAVIIGVLLQDPKTAMAAQHPLWAPIDEDHLFD
jgi:hypothetical protein